MAAVNSRWQRPLHLDYISDAIVRTIFDPQSCKRLLIEAPPRHGKSETVCVGTPTWYLDIRPSDDVIESSYGHDFARKWGRKTRDTIEANPDELRIRVSDDQSAASDWEVELRRGRTEKKGSMRTCGAGGPLTGHGANLLIIDDPHKNYEEACSEVYRDKIWDWYLGTARDRLEPGAAVICCMQRWHEDDFAGRVRKRLVETGREDWTIITLPAFATENDPLGREVGEPLWPERYDRDALEALEATLGPYLFAAKFQQDPKPAEGSLFKRSMFRYFSELDGFYELYRGDGDVLRVPKDRCWIVQTCDPAATEKDQSHYFVLQTWIITPDKDLLLYDVLREKAETTKHKPMMTSGYRRYHPALMGVENKTFGLNIIQELIKEGLPIKPIAADTSKHARALPLQARYNVGAAYHRLDAPWLTAYEDELVAFPNSTHDDQVDAASQAALILAEYKPPSPGRIGTSGKKRVSAGARF